MPILKVITGHTSVHGVKNYLEKGGRALAQDFFNLSWDEREMEGYDEVAKASVPWDVEMDATRARHNHDREWRGLRGRTFKHFILSPDPEDTIDLASLRELSCDWALKHFGDFEIAITYHDDNENHIPHAHIVVNCTNLATGYKLHTDNPKELNEELQCMARERGLRGLSNERQPRTGAERLAMSSESADVPPRTRQAVYFGREERGLVAAGSWSWVADIRNRVSIAQALAKDEGEFRSLLETMEIDVSDNSPKARRSDWIFSLRDEPSKKVSGERLGMIFGKEALLHRFARRASYTPADKTVEAIRAHAASAVELNDLVDLDELAAALETCERFNIRSLDDFEKRISGRSVSRETQATLIKTRDYMAEKKLLPQSAPSNAGARHNNGTTHARMIFDQPARARASQDAAVRQRQAAIAQQQEAQRRRRGER